jgi:Xaa-Pro aminopeptidase
VGAALNVHEGPHSISKRYYITQPLQAGMIVSNEPGYYEDGNFGVRIENLLTIKEVRRPLPSCYSAALVKPGKPAANVFPTQWHRHAALRQ